MRQIIRSAAALESTLADVRAFVCKHGYPVEVRANGASSKTMAQLGGLFAAWIPEISQFEGESEDDIHEKLKAKFLARIYCANPIGPEQTMWVALLIHYQEIGDMAKLEEHSLLISLAWSKVGQMRQYMDAIHNHYTTLGLVLQELEKGR